MFPAGSLETVETPLKTGILVPSYLFAKSRNTAGATLEGEQFGPVLSSKILFVSTNITCCIDNLLMGTI